jgi:hypothetical protein
MQPPPGYEEYDTDGAPLVWQLLKTVNGIKQGPRRWHLMLRSLMEQLGMRACRTDPSVFVKRSRSGGTLIVCPWVDVLWYFFGAVDAAEFAEIEARIRLQFGGMKEAEDLHSVLGMRVQRDRRRGVLTVDQQVYTEDLLRQLNMEHAKAVPTPAIEKNLSKADGPSTEEEKKALGNVPYREAVGSLIWLAGQTRPDIAFPVAVLTRFMANPGQAHWEATKRVLRYLHGTKTAKLVYRARAEPAASVRCV